MARKIFLSRHAVNFSTPCAWRGVKENYLNGTQITQMRQMTTDFYFVQCSSLISLSPLVMFLNRKNFHSVFLKTIWESSCLTILLHFCIFAFAFAKKSKGMYHNGTSPVKLRLNLQDYLRAFNTKLTLMLSTRASISAKTFSIAATSVGPILPSVTKAITSKLAK